ncbi:MAG: hypothetical protein KGI70_02740 [Patescibacteria group bacterium]|nr:hypothetical protein [Patescibacteria group bacterium]
MTKTGWISVAVLAVLVGGGAWYYTSHKSELREYNQAQNMGTYPYTCANGAQFTMTPNADVAQITLSAGSQGMWTGDATLKAASSTAGARFEGTSATGQKIVFVGAGEDVTLSVGSTTTTCNPVPDQNNAPFNWGDAGEGGGVQPPGSQPSAEQVVSESIVGKWQSTDDPKYVREFKGDGTAVDYYDGKAVTSGTWKAFLKADAPATVSFPLVDNQVYLQMKMQGSQAEFLDFKITKLTPEELQLIYLERGGVLNFKSVQ